MLRDLGQGASAFIQVDNDGPGALDLSRINPTLDADFRVNYGTQQPIQPANSSSSA
jgi:hypothetical protein